MLPTRALSEADRDYAVAFAVPTGTKGLKLITSPFTATGASRFHHPVSSEHKMIETLTVFDDVFVPWERVFLCGETQFAGALALGFVQFHRFTAVSYKIPDIDLMIGAAMLAAEANGIEKAGHVREKLSRLIAWRETVRGLTGGGRLRVPADGAGGGGAQSRDDQRGQAVLRRAVPHDGPEGPGHRRRPAGHRAGRGGPGGAGDEGLRGALPGGKKGFGATNRLKVMNLIRDLLTSDIGGYNEVLSIHAEGSLEAQKLTILREFDAVKARAFAAQCAYLGG